LELAIALGFRGAWMMDDDAVPQSDSFEKLLAVGEGLLGPDGAGFLCSVAVNPQLTTEQASGHPHPSADFVAQREASQTGMIAVSSAAFLGVLVNLELAAKEELPNPDFFIWCDDVEYTHRLARKYGAMCVPDSLIVHHSLAMEASEGRKSLGWKYRYQVRNRLWLARWGLDGENQGTRIYSAILALRATIIELRVNPRKWAVLKVTISAWASGLMRGRRCHPVGSLLANSAVGREWMATVGREWMAAQRSRVTP
jgi:GT2 family glycosyltransferase